MPHRDDDDLPFGLYERLVTAGLKSRLLRFDSARIVTGAMDPAEAHATLARHIEDVVARALNELPHEDGVAKQTELVNRLLELVGGLDDVVEIPPEQLTSIQPATGLPGAADIVAPLVALSASDLVARPR